MILQGDGLCDADTYANGCSVPLGLDTPFKETFTKACDKHDICYGCVSSCNLLWWYILKEGGVYLE